jgi:nucleotide-binding universal stress UspA family protein
MTSTSRLPVVVGIDGSDDGACAADYAAWEAHRRGVELRLIFARQPASLLGPSDLILDAYAEDRDWVRSLLDRSVHEIVDAHPGLAVHATAVVGRPAGVLVDESAHAGLVVVGTRSSGGVIGHLAGSVAAQVAAHASGPVIVVRATLGRRYDGSMLTGRRVVVGVDGSRPAELAVAFAAEEAVARHAELHAVLAWSLLDADIARDVPRQPLDLDDAAVRADRLLDEALAGSLERYPGLTIRRHAVHDADAVRVLLDQSDGAGLMVVGSRGVGGFAGLRFGSTVDGLVRHATVPVAVVHSDLPDH